MASVASTYARAFADVVLSEHLDADRSLAELRTIAGRCWPRVRVAASVGESRDSR